MDTLTIIVIFSIIAFCMWRNWLTRNKTFGKTDQDFINHIADDENADKMIDELSASRSLNKICGYLMIAGCILMILVDKDFTSKGSATMIAMSMGAAAASLALSYSDDSKIKIILLAKSLKQNNKD